MENREEFWFHDCYCLSVREGYLEYCFRMFKKSCISDLEPYRSVFEKGVLHPFRAEFMDAVNFWGKDIFFAIMEKHHIRYGDSTNWLNKNEEEFVHKGGLWKEMTQEYPVLNRIIAELASDFKEHICEIVRVLYQHQQEIADYFFQGKQGKIKEVGAGLSDYHSGHRSVHIITYSHGGKLVYKPRSMRTDLAWNTFLQNTASHAQRSFYIPRVLDYGGYGFVDYISRIPAGSRDDVKIYFQHMGFMAALVYLLGGRDIHCENIIAHGSCPVIVDTETIASAEVRKVKRVYLEDTCMFPWLLKEKGYYGGQDALSSGEAAGKNLPQYAGKCWNGREFADQVVIGFEQAYRMFLQMDARERKVRLSVWDGCPVRNILKSTSYYYNVLRLLRTREHLRSPAAFHEALYRNIECNDAEKNALYHLQIPIFAGNVNSQELFVRMEDLCEADLARKKDDIKRWLNPRTAKSGAGQYSEMLMIEPGGDPRNLLEKAATAALEYWNARIKDRLLNGTGSKALIVERKTFHYYDAGLHCYFLESIPGWILVNLCWMDQMDRYRLDELFTLFLDRLKKQMEEVPAAAMERGLLEGAGGLLYVLAQLYRKTKNTVAGELCEHVLQEVMQGECIRNRYNTSWLYGERGLLLGLYALPKEMMTDSVRTRIESMQQILKVNQAPALEEILNPPVITNRLCQNDSLFCGNAGAVCHLADRARKDHSSELRCRAIKVAAALADRIEHEGTYPLQSKVTRSCSFLYGEGGILYSFKRMLDDTDLPKIWRDPL